MELIVKENRARFDANVIKAGYAIYGKHASCSSTKITFSFSLSFATVTAAPRNSFLLWITYTFSATSAR